ncbi:hypothetical protein BGZ65_007370 [Modicella reniformis]|uniref:Plasmid pRiA4b Orf3-like domain-containing protein n=1 Tax=Modicella reniformis TaxID=1440133 RepID=A0A9P6IJK6_9FUNG|nr:hypothetical protein BGZ65_007370 [Modicella reniformis]
MSSSEQRQVYSLKISLRQSRPSIWRRLHVWSDTTLGQLHEIILITMGWNGSHAHGFEINDVSYGDTTMFDPLLESGLGVTVDEKVTRLYQVARPGTHFCYLYDYGDDWCHDIMVEQVVEQTRGMKVPNCTAGKLACPPDDCGGIWGYKNMLKELKNPESEERDHFLEWLGGSFDPTSFDRRGVNVSLQAFRT